MGHREYPDLPELAEHPAFTDVRRRVYHWTRRMSRADTLTLLSTHSAYRMLDEPTLARLFDALAPLLPDEVEFAGGTVLFLARAGRNARSARVTLTRTTEYLIQRG